jgi:cytochrome c-type biogenesis protein CcmE
MKARHKRFGFLVVGLAVLGIAAVLVFRALDSNLSYFYSASEVAYNQAPTNHVIRLGGMVVDGSFKRGEGLTVHFTVTDNASKVNVEYTGILPDLFQEGQGVIAQGKLNSDGVFVADEVLAKHDETYMPPEVADSMKPLKTSEGQTP